MRTSSRAAEFDPVEARKIIADLFTPRAWIYWTDFLASLVLGYGAAATYFRAAPFSLLQLGALTLASFALFRVGSYIHEIVHFKKGEMTAFTVGWNMLAGIPMLMPSSFYANHLDHHSAHHYGTGQDGEYLPLGSGRFGELGKFFAQVLFLPAQIGVRFLVLTPISFARAAWRNWTLERMSSFVINLKYRRKEIPAQSPRRWWAVVELCCCLRMLAMVAAPLVGPRLGHPELTWWRIPQLYVLAMCVLGLNYLRNLVAHRYESRGEPMSHSDQLLDSVNITGGWIFTELFFPLGLRYHALHHLFPTLPYHNLYAAHARLMRELPEHSPYRDTVFATFWQAMSNLLRNEAHAMQEEHPGAEEWYARREEMLARRARGEALFPPEREEIHAARPFTTAPRAKAG